MHIAQLISDVIYYMQGSRLQDTQWSPIGPWGFQLGLRASISPIGCSSPPARSYHHDIGKYALLSTNFWCHLLSARIAPTRHPVDPKKSNRVLELPALITGLCQFYEVPVAPARSSGPLLIELSSRSTAPPGRRRAKHHSSLGMADSGQQTHRHHL